MDMKEKDGHTKTVRGDRQIETQTAETETETDTQNHAVCPESLRYHCRAVVTRLPLLSFPSHRTSFLTPAAQDFGSIGEAHVTFQSHREASRLQDFCAEACSILYRAPE